MRAELEVQNSTCDFEDAGSFESTYWPEPSTASVLRFGGEEDCNPNEYEVTVFRGGSRGPTLPAELRVGFEPKVKPADKGPEDPGDEPKEGKADKLVHASDAKTHAGGRSYSTAERIEPGTIKGSIAPGESLYYRFPVSWGQRPIAKVTFEPTKKKPRSRNGQIEIATPMRTIESNYSFESLTNDKPVSTSHDKSSFAYYQNREDGNGKQRSWAYAGDYYAIVSVDGYKDNFAPSEENKFTLTVDTDGAPVNGPDWQMLTEDGPEPSDTAPGADAGADGDGGGNAADADASPDNSASQSDSDDGANAKFYITGSVIMVVLLLGLIIGSSPPTLESQGTRRKLGHENQKTPRPTMSCGAGCLRNQERLRRKTDEGLALGVLRRTTCTVQTSLLTLNCTSVAGQEASLLQLGALLWVVLVQSTSDSQTHCAGLAGWATAVQRCLDVELVLALQQDQWVLDQLLVQLVREVVLQRTTVAGDLAGTLNQTNTDDSALAATDGLDWALVNRSNWSGLFDLVALDSDGLTDGCGEFLVRSLGWGELFDDLCLEVLVVLRHYCATCLIS